MFHSYSSPFLKNFRSVYFLFLNFFLRILELPTRRQLGLKGEIFWALGLGKDLNIRFNIMKFGALLLDISQISVSQVFCQEETTLQDCFLFVQTKTWSHVISHSNCLKLFSKNSFVQHLRGVND